MLLFSTNNHKIVAIYIRVSTNLRQLLATYANCLSCSLRRVSNSPIYRHACQLVEIYVCRTTKKQSPFRRQINDRKIVNYWSPNLSYTFCKLTQKNGVTARCEQLTTN